MAMTLNSLASVDRAQNRLDLAGGRYREALVIYRQLAQQDPDKYLPFVAGALSNLGFLDRTQNQIEVSRTDYQEALDLLRKLSQRDQRYASDVARVEASLNELEKKN